MALLQAIGKNLFPTLMLPTLFTNSLIRTLTTTASAGRATQPGYRTKCASLEPRCSEKSLQAKKTKGKCSTAEQQKQFLLNPECCNSPCPDILPRFDDLYYRPSDKAKHRYVRTWNEFTELKIAPKKICCYEHFKYPPMERRKRSERPQTACEMHSKDKGQGQKSCLGIDGKTRCTKIRLPRCASARDPPKCFVVRAPSNCKKVCTPYPAYSECRSPKSRQRRPVECNCLSVGPICTV